MLVLSIHLGLTSYIVQENKPTSRGILITVSWDHTTDFMAVLHDASEAAKRVFWERLHLANNHENLRAPSPMPHPPGNRALKRGIMNHHHPIRLYLLGFPPRKNYYHRSHLRSVSFFFSTFSSDGLSWSQDDPATAPSDVWCSRRSVSLSDPTWGCRNEHRNPPTQSPPKKRTHPKFLWKAQPLNLKTKISRAQTQPVFFYIFWLVAAPTKNG